MSDADVRFGEKALDQCSNYRGTERFPPTAVLDPRVIHVVEVSALSVPRSRPTTAFSYFDHCS